MSDRETTTLKGSNKGKPFRWFMIVIVCVMILTGLITMVDIWSNEVVEATGSSETRRIILPDGHQVELASDSELRFHKGAPNELLLVGVATFNLDDQGQSLTIDTRDLHIEARDSEFRIWARDSTVVDVTSGKIHIFLRDSNGKEGESPIMLEQGDSYGYSLPAK